MIHEMVLDPEKIQIEFFLYHGLLCKGLGHMFNLNKYVKNLFPLLKDYI